MVYTYILVLEASDYQPPDVRIYRKKNPLYPFENGSRNTLILQTGLKLTGDWSEIFVDEPLIQIDDQNYWLWWIAYEPNLNVCLMMVHLPRERRTIFFLCCHFFKQLRNRYGSRKPVFAEGTHWYNDACKWLRLKNSVYGTELRNIMERFIQQI
jgi:transposase-like protein